MNLSEAIKFLESKGWKVYPRKNKYSVWSPGQKNARQDCYYSARELIHLAKAYQSNRSNGIYKGVVKTGPGGLNCPCCSPPPKVLKKISKRKIRRKSLEDMD